MATHRLYYRIADGPTDRPGGSWWFRDFDDPAALEASLLLLIAPPETGWDIAAEVYRLDAYPLPQHRPMQIHPPATARRIYPAAA